VPEPLEIVAMRCKFNHSTGELDPETESEPQANAKIAEGEGLVGNEAGWL
jgi:hypothetical protein